MFNEPIFLLLFVQWIPICNFFLPAGQYSSWSPWSECSKKCDGEQTRTRQCIRSSADCGEDLTDRRECGQASWNSGCFCEYDNGIL